MKFRIAVGWLAYGSIDSSPIHMSAVLTDLKGCTCADDCDVSKVKITQEFDEPPVAGLTYAELQSFLGSGPVSDRMRLVRVDHVGLACIDDRLPESFLSTPGGDLGEFILGLDTFLDSLPHNNAFGVIPTRPHFTQSMVASFLQKYLQSIPNSRPFYHCTDDRAVRHVEQELQFENLDLSAPPDHLKDRLLEVLTTVENQGDSHIRLLLKAPEWYHLDPHLVPMVLKAFYSLLWKREPHAELLVLQGTSNPRVFAEIDTNKKCEAAGIAPLVDPAAFHGPALLSHMSAASTRRLELAGFFSRIANATPHKVDKGSFRDRMDRHGWMALDTTGKRIASDLPFFSVSYV